MGRKAGPISGLGSVENHRIGVWRAHIYVRRKHIIGPLRVRQEDAQRDLEAMRAAPSLTAVPEVARQLRDAAAQDRQATMSVSFPEPAQQDDNILVSDGGVGALAPAVSDAQGSRSRVLKSRKSVVKVKKTIAECHRPRRRQPSIQRLQRVARVNKKVCACVCVCVCVCV